MDIVPLEVGSSIVVAVFDDIRETEIVEAQIRLFGDNLGRGTAKGYIIDSSEAFSLRLSPYRLAPNLGKI